MCARPRAGPHVNVGTMDPQSASLTLEDNDEERPVARKRSWKWGYSAPPGPWIVPSPHKLSHLIGDAYERDLRRHVWGYWLLAAFPFIPMFGGAVAGIATALHHQWTQGAQAAGLIVCTLAAAVAATGYALRSIDTEPPQKVSLRLPLDEEMP